MRGKNGFCAVGGGSVIGFIAAIRGGRIEEMFLCAAGVQRRWFIAIRGGRTAGRNAEAVSAQPRREGVGNCSITGNKRRWVFIAGVGKCGGAPFGQPKLTASAVRRAAGLLYRKLWHNKKALPLKKAALLFTKPDGRIRNIILFSPSRREMLKGRAERTGMSA